MNNIYSNGNEKSALLITIKWLTIIFIMLKLVGWFSFSWLWVFSPLWLPILGMFALVVFSLVFLTIVLTFVVLYAIMLNIVAIVTTPRK